MRDSPLACGDVEERAAVGWRWFETLLLTAAVPVGRFAAGSLDPFALGGSFPWLMFVPFVIGLKHGLSCAAASVVAMAGGAVVHADWAGAALPPARVGFACGAIVFVASRACDAQRERCERLRRRVLQLERAWELERRARAVLRVSHDRLASGVADSPADLEVIVRSLAARVAAVRGVQEFGRLVLELLAQQAELQEGSVWLEAGGRCVEAATTRAGKRGPRQSSSLVQQAMRRRGLAMLLEGSDFDAGEDDGGLAAMPLITADGEIRGAVLVEEMPFESFEPAELQKMAVLLSAMVAIVDAETWDQWVVEANQQASSGRPERSSREARATRWDAIA